MGGQGIIRPHGTIFTMVQRVTDAIWIAAIHWFAYQVYGVDGIAGDTQFSDWGIEQTFATAAALVFYYVTANIAGLYQAWRGVPLTKQIIQIWAAWLPVMMGLLAGAFALKATDKFSRLASGGWLLTAPVALMIWRGVIHYILRSIRATGRNTRTVAICGATSIGVELAKRILTSPELGMRLLGFFDDRTPERIETVQSELGGVVGRFSDVIEMAREGKVDVIYLALPLKAEPRVNALLRELADSTASVYIVPDFFVYDLLHGQWSALGDLPVVSVFETPFYGVDGWVKRLEDMVLGTLFLSIASPVMLLIALAIKLNSKGPVFFKQRRYGLNGGVIDVLKFRSMTVAEDGDDVKQATKTDDRITKVGRFLRRSSLDEIPQLIHVVTGTMSLVGPRPHAVAHNELYRTKISGYMLRHKVKPGLTGWAQVNGWRGETDQLYKMEKRIDHDLEYIRRWGLVFDLKIIFQTVWGMAFGGKVRQNAY